MDRRCFWLTSLLVGCLSTPASAQNGQIIILDAVPGRSLQSPASPAAASTTFTVLPSVLTSTISPYGSGPQTRDIKFQCVIFPPGAVVPNCDMTLTWFAQSGSGGHVHNTNRPPGKFTTENGVTGGSTDPGAPGSLMDNSGPTGTLSATYTAPEVSGVINATLSGKAFVNGVLTFFDPTPFTIGVQFDGLQPISGSGLQVATFSNMHNNFNGNATAEVGIRLQDTASLFFDDLTHQGTPPAQVPLLPISALSLPQGGLFDFQTEWRPPHVSHRFGDDADVVVQLFFDDERATLARVVREARFTTPVPCESPSNPGANHWHLRLP